MLGDRKKLVMCQACRALVEASANTCPMCGRESVPSLRARAGAALSGAQSLSFIILTANILLFVAMSLVEVNNGRGAEAFLQSASGPVLYDFGALSPPAVAAGQLWRLVTFNFLHIGLMHLLFNSSALYQIGPQVEQIYGSQKFVVIYIVTGILSGVTSFAFNIGGAGASGAIFGLIGLMAVYGYREGGTFGQAIMRQMIIWGGIGFIFGAMIGANNAAHAGGFVAGGAIGFLVKGDHPATNRASISWSIAAVASVVVLASSFAIAGSKYGDFQKKAAEYDQQRRQFEAGGKNVILLSERMSAVQKLWRESQNRSEQTLQELSASFKQAYTALEQVPAIDEQSDSIKSRMIALLKKRADELPVALANRPAPARINVVSLDDLKEANDIFAAYRAWEDSILDKYGLVRDEEEHEERR